MASACAARESLDSFPYVPRSRRDPLLEWPKRSTLDCPGGRLIMGRVDRGDVYIARESDAARIEAPMITLTIILLLVFVPPFRRALSRMFWGLLTAAGIVFLIAPRSRPRHRRL